MNVVLCAVRSGVLFLGLALTMTVGAVGEAAATSGEEIEITVILDRNTSPFTRTWESAGAFSDGGVWQTVGFHFGAANSPVVGLAHFDTLFTNAAGTGTFTVRRKIQVRLAEDDPDATVHGGVWHVIDATGIYAGLRGHGKLGGTDEGGVSESVMVGEVTLDP